MKLIHHVVKSSSMDFNDWESNSVGYWFCFLSLWGLLISSDTSTKVDITAMHQTLSSQKCQLSGFILPLLDIMSVMFQGLISSSPQVIYLICAKHDIIHFKANFHLKKKTFYYIIIINFWSSLFPDIIRSKYKKKLKVLILLHNQQELIIAALKNLSVNYLLLLSFLEK